MKVNSFFLCSCETLKTRTCCQYEIPFPLVRRLLSEMNEVNDEMISSAPYRSVRQCHTFFLVRSFLPSFLFGFSAAWCDMLVFRVVQDMLIIADG